MARGGGALCRLALERGAGGRWKSAWGGGGAWRRARWSHVLLLQLEFGPGIPLYGSGVHPLHYPLHVHFPILPPSGADFIRAVGIS